MGPNDELTVSDNQGHWMPASKLNLVKKGGFYGMMPAAQHEIELRKGEHSYKLNPSDPRLRKEQSVAPFDKDAPIPLDYDQPICWLPMNMDNSSGGQVWATTDKWGPLKEHMLFMSYGRGTLFHVMTEEVEGVTQAAMVKFPLKFQTGLMRGRVNPKDGQVYVSGLRGWQTDGSKDGVEIKFTGELDPAAAGDTANYAVEEWNYTYSGKYGSPEISVADPKVARHDKVEIKSVRLAKNRKTVLLEIPGFQPMNQMKIKFNIKAVDGTAISQDIYSTIHKLGPKTVASVK